MYIYSEKTNKKYDSVEECLEAEKAFDEAKKVEEIEKAHLAETKQARLDEINKLVNDFVKDYGICSLEFTFNHDGCKPSWRYALFNRLFDF